MGEVFSGIYLVIAWVAGWFFLGEIQAKLYDQIWVSNLSDYIWKKVISALILGLFTAPFYIGYKLIKIFILDKRTSASTESTTE